MIDSLFKQKHIFFLLFILLFLVLAAGCNDNFQPDEVEPLEEYEDLSTEELPEPEEETLIPEEEEKTEEEAETIEEQNSSASDDSISEEPALPIITDGDYLLALVTKETTLKSDYIPSDLKAIPDYMNPSYSMQLRAEALEQLELLWNASAYDGVKMHIRSAYRSYNTQKGLFQDYASRHGEEEANRFSARAGQSEHQLGTTVDFGGTSVDYKAAFADTPQGSWLAENAYYFGFAMSYPENKEHITGYIFEPWHYRYIGIEAADEWRASGKTLREFLEEKPQYYD